MQPTWQTADGSIRLFLGDCLDILPTLEAGSVDAVVTDPPFPDYHVELYGECDIRFLDSFSCRQFVFWSTRAEFPLTWDARHVWDKRKGGAGSAYEFVYERNGSAEQWVWPFVSLQNVVRAGFSKDVFTGHPSQKPWRLIAKIIELTSAELVADPFMGSGTTGVACARLGRRFIGIEKEPKYFDIAVRRIEAELNRHPLIEPKRAIQRTMEAVA